MVSTTVKLFKKIFMEEKIQPLKYEKKLINVSFNQNTMECSLL